MTHSRYYYRKRKKMRDKYKRMMDGKAAKRLRQMSTAVECGRIVTTGCFGDHTIRAIDFDHETHVRIEVDGNARSPRTLRGCCKVLAAMLEKQVTPK